MRLMRGKLGFGFSRTERASRSPFLLGRSIGPTVACGDLVSPMRRSRGAMNKNGSLRDRDSPRKTIPSLMLSNPFAEVKHVSSEFKIY